MEDLGRRGTWHSQLKLSACGERWVQLDCMALGSLDHKRPGYQAKEVRAGSGALPRMRGKNRSPWPGQDSSTPPAFLLPLYGRDRLGRFARLFERILQPGLTNWPPGSSHFSSGVSWGQHHFLLAALHEHILPSCGQSHIEVVLLAWGDRGWCLGCSPKAPTLFLSLGTCLRHCCLSHSWGEGEQRTAPASLRQSIPLPSPLPPPPTPTQGLGAFLPFNRSRDFLQGPCLCWNRSVLRPLCFELQSNSRSWKYHLPEWLIRAFMWDIQHNGWFTFMEGLYVNSHLWATPLCWAEVLSAANTGLQSLNLNNPHSPWLRVPHSKESWVWSETGHLKPLV